MRVQRFLIRFRLGGGNGLGLLGRIVCRNFAFFDQFCEIDDLVIGFSGVLGNHAPPHGVMCSGQRPESCKIHRFILQKRQVFVSVYGKRRK